MQLPSQAQGPPQQQHPMRTEPSRREEGTEFIPALFKVQKCSRHDPQDKKKCQFFHNVCDRHRKDVNRYSCESCREQLDFYANPCIRTCPMQELLYHPKIIKTQLCRAFPNVGACYWAEQCAFAHSWDQLTVPHYSPHEMSTTDAEFYLYKFKTLWCPLGDAHDWNSCPYAHTFLDLRRTPLLGYSPCLCREWLVSFDHGQSDYLAYGQLCPRGPACRFAHGKKERLYHPYLYKTRPCNGDIYCWGNLCPFFHSDSEKRSKVKTITWPDENNGDQLLAEADAIIRSYPTFLNAQNIRGRGRKLGA